MLILFNIVSFNMKIWASDGVYWLINACKNILSVFLHLTYLVYQVSKIYIKLKLLIKSEL